LQTTWWRSVNEWAFSQNKRAREITEEHGDAAGLAFQKEGTRRNDELRTSIKKAWTAKHPKMDSYWVSGLSAFSVVFHERNE
jgi:hypothetical protein